MTAYELLSSLRAEGLKVWAQGDTIAVAPSSGLKAEQRELIKSHKHELLAALATRTAAAPIAQDWEGIRRVGSRLGDVVRVDGRRFQLWGVTPGGAICWDGCGFTTVNVDRLRL